MPVHLVRRELNCDKGEGGLVRPFFHPEPQLRRDYPLNLSISISGRKNICIMYMVWYVELSLWGMELLLMERRHNFNIQ